MIYGGDSMKNIMIINNTDLNYEDIGIIINQFSKRVINSMDILIIKYKHKKFLLQIRNLKNYLEWRFEKYDGR